MQHRAVGRLRQSAFSLPFGTSGSSIERAALKCSLHSNLRRSRRVERRLSKRQHGGATALGQSSQAFQLETLPSAYPVGTRKYTAAGWLAAFSIVAVAGIVVYRVLQQRRQDMSVVETQGEFLHDHHFDNEEFKDALASVRQVVTFQRAVQSMREGDTARAMVELYRVLEQNAICRTPLNTASFSEEELEGIYRLHLHNSELPLQYATLLQLRQLLNVANKRAEELEKELKGSAYQFSI